MSSYLKSFVLFLLLIFKLTAVFAESCVVYAPLTIKVKLNKAYSSLWDSLIISSKDTCIRIKRNMNGHNLVNVPDGDYTIQLKSVLNGSIKKQIIKKNTTVVELNAERYYKAYTDTASIIYKMKDGDTSIVYYIAGVSWAPPEDYFMVVKQDDKYIIVSKTELNEWRSIQVFNYEFKDFMELGKYTAPKKKGSTQGLGVYYWQLGHTVLKQPCGMCLFGFMLRKRLVKGP